MVKIIKGVRIAATIAIIAAVAYFIIHTLFSRWNELKEYQFSPNVSYIIIFLIILFVFYLIAPAIWALSLRIFGQKVRYLKVLKIWHSAQLVRYIPGNVAFVLGRTEVGKKEGIPREKNLIATSLELALVVVACLTIFLIYAILSATETSWLLFILIPLGLIILHPKIFLPIFNFFLKLVKKPRIEHKISYKKIIVLFIFVLFTQIIEGTAYAFLLRAIFDYNLTLLNILKFTAIYEGAWVIGFLSFLTPSGIGIREAALVLLLEPFVPVTLAIIFSIFARICCIIIEVIVASFVLIYNKFNDKKECECNQ